MKQCVDFETVELLNNLFGIEISSITYERGQTLRATGNFGVIEFYSIKELEQ